MKKLKLNGRYNTFSNTFNKARLYFTMTNDLSSVISDLYQFGLMSGDISINGSEPSRCEIAELSIKGHKSTIIFYVDVNEASLSSIAKHAFDKTIEIELTYNGGEPTERVSGKFYAYMVNLIRRVSSAANLGSPEALRYIIDSVYGYSVMINENMSQEGAVQLVDLIKRYAEEEQLDVDIEQYAAEIPFLEKRRENKKCALCDRPLSAIADGVPLCKSHKNEYDKLGRDKFLEKHML